MTSTTRSARFRVSYLAICLAAVLLVGCEKFFSGSDGGGKFIPPTSPDGVQPSDQPSDKPPITQFPNVGYGLSDWWNQQEPEAYMALLRAHGLGLSVLELHPSSLGNAQPPWDVIRRTIEAARRQRITVLVHAINLNCRGLPQPTCLQVPLNTPASVSDLVGRIARELGTTRLIMEVAESMDGGAYFEAVARAWPGDLVGRNVRELHRCDPDPMTWPSGRGILFVTDCGASLTRNAGGIATWARKFKEKVILYDLSQSPDRTVLQAMREALR